MSRFVVVLPLAPLVAGDSFAVRHWPLHITVLAPFTTYTPLERIADALGEVATQQTAIEAVAEHDELFGRRHDVPVTLVRGNPDLVRLRDLLIIAVRPLAAQPNEPAFTGGQFRPHVTMKGDRRVHAGDVLLLRQLALVDMAPWSAPEGRMVLATFALDGIGAAGLRKAE